MRLTREDVIVVVAVSIGWLNQEYHEQLTAVLKRISHPVALILGGQYDPLQKFAAAPERLRDLLQEVPNRLGLWRTDLAGFDALAYGGAFAAIGAGASLRHLVPAGERPESSKPFPHYPSVLVPELLRFSGAEFLANTYADCTPPRCHCQVCGGTFLESFYSLKAPARAAAHAHNAATWNSWLPSLFAHERLGDRQLWWRNRCQAAIDAHATENARTGAKRFKPPKPLKKWATLPQREQPSSATPTPPSSPAHVAQGIPISGPGGTPLPGNANPPQ